MWFSKRKLTFEKVAKFNYELDSNENLKIELKDLAMRRNQLSRKKYLSEMLKLFNNAGFDISMKELDMLLLFRQKTDQILLETKTASKDDGWWRKEKWNIGIIYICHVHMLLVVIGVIIK